MAGIIGSTPGMLAAFTVGQAASAALEPAFELPRQDAWARNPNRILDASLLARLVAQGGVDLSDAADEAKRDGYDKNKLEALVYLEQTVPGFPEALNLWRRGLISEDLFTHVLVKAGLDQRYAVPLSRLKDAELVGIGDIAYGIVRGLLPSPAWVPVPPPTSGTTVPRFPVVDLDPVQLAAKLGFDEPMLQLMTGRSGLSLAPGLAAVAYFRGLINEQDFVLAVAEGDLRTEWAETLKEASRQILTPGEYVEAHLRGWIDQATMYRSTARHGMSQDDTDLAFKTKGRPISTHQITTGLARGGTYPSTYEDVPEPYRKAIQESDIRPEWASLDYANRYTYPSPFVARSLAEAGDLGDVSEVQQLLEEIGWKPSLAAKVAAKWLPSGAAADPHVKKAQTQLWSAAHKSYVDGLTDDADATADLNAAGVEPGSVAAVLALWSQERSVIRRALTPAQIKKAIGQPGLDEAWAQARLEQLGYTVSDAMAFLAE